MLRSLVQTTAHLAGSRVALLSPFSTLASSSMAVTRGLANTASAQPQQQPQRANQSTCAWACENTHAIRQVRHSVRKRRPVVRGEAVAFHIRDLVNESIRRPLRRTDQEVKTNKSYESDLIVVLDMDECLIHSQFFTPSNAQMYAHQLRNTKKLARNNSPHMVDHFQVVLPDGDQVHVNMRPGLSAFLEQVSAKYETHIFTAAMEVYAKPVLDRLDPTGTRFAGRWYREHCSYSAGAYVKDLANLPLGNTNSNTNNLDRVVLVDNNPLSFLANPANGILVKSFYNDATDASLPAVLELLEELDASASDVRPVLDRRFGLQQALQNMTVSQQHHV